MKQEKEDLEASLKEITEENQAIKTKLECYKLEMDGKKKVKSLTIMNSETFCRSYKYLVITIEK